MPFTTGSQPQRVADFLTAGNTLTAAQAQRKFGVSNLRAVISTVAERVEAYGNYEVFTTETPSGVTCYGIDVLNRGI